MLAVEDRIYGLSLIWREAEYHFAYWDERPGLDWNARYREFLPRVAAAENILDYYGELMRFVAVLKDGHTYVTLPQEIRPPYTYKFGTTFIEGKHVLLSRPKSSSVPLLSRILRINGMPVEEYTEKYLYPYIWHEQNPRGIFYYGLLGYLINCREKERAVLATDGGVLELEADSREEEVYAPFLSHPAHREADVVFATESGSGEIFKNGIAYVNAETFAFRDVADRLAENASRFKDCRGFIIDIRGNNGGSGNHGRALAELFLQEDIPEPPSRSPVTIADYSAFGQYRDLETLNRQDAWEKKIYDVCTHRYYEEENGIVKKKSGVTFRQPAVVLAGPYTASAAEDFLVCMKYGKRAAVIGANSAGTNGQPFMGSLPGGGRFGICTQKCYLHDGTSYNNVGIAPDIAVENTIEDRRRGFDRELDRAISFLICKF